MLVPCRPKTIDSNSTVEFNTTTVSFFGTTHSIPDSVGVCFHTSKGAVVYTGDFKFDQTPIGNSGADLVKWHKSEMKAYFAYYLIVQTQSAQAIQVQKRSWCRNL